MNNKTDSHTKTWNSPALVRLGTIANVAAATSAACQTFNGLSANCNTFS